MAISFGSYLVNKERIFSAVKRASFSSEESVSSSINFAACLFKIKKDMFPLSFFCGFVSKGVYPASKFGIEFDGAKTEGYV